jgi:hypothetical protein
MPFDFVDKPLLILIILATLLFFCCITSKPEDE